MVRGQSAGSHVDQEFVACACMRRKMMPIIKVAIDMGIWGYGGGNRVWSMGYGVCDG